MTRVFQDVPDPPCPVIYRDAFLFRMTGRQDRSNSRARMNMITRSRMIPLLWSLLLGLAAFPVAGDDEDTDSIPVELVKWNSQESSSRLFRSTHNRDFFPLSNNFVSQNNKIFCGLASSSMVLNALRLGKAKGLPEDRGSIGQDELAWLPEDFNPFLGKYTSGNVLNDRTKKRIEVLGKPIEINGDMKSDFGLQLRQLAQVLRAHKLDVIIRVVDEQAPAETIRREIMQNLITADDFVLVNYSRKALGQSGGGHISPLAAYDEDSDSFLIMDVNPNRAPWVWVRSDDLIRAMRTFDTIENRGYLLISEPG